MKNTTEIKKNGCSDAKSLRNELKAEISQLTDKQLEYVLQKIKEFSSLPE